VWVPVYPSTPDNNTWDNIHENITGNTT